MHHFESFNRVKSTQDEKVSFIKGNDLKFTHVDLFSFFIFKSVRKTLLRKKHYGFVPLEDRGYVIPMKTYYLLNISKCN